MKKKLSTLLTVLLIAMFAISTADAGGGIKISRADFSLGSLITDGILQGTGQTAITVVLTAEGTCAIGETPVEVLAAGQQFLPGSEESGTKKKDNRRAFHVETEFQIGDDGVCDNEPGPNDSFVLWTQATISVYNGQVGLCEVTDLCGGIGLTSSIAAAADNVPLVQQDYNCITLQDAYTVSCTPVKNNGSDGSNNGGFAICHATGSKKNPYVLITINGNGLNGHSKHTGDIIPAPADGCPK